MRRYSIIKDKREIVLLKGNPCVWGECSFCDYIEDNSENEEEIRAVNTEALEKVTGELGELEVINSGSVFELQMETLEHIKKIVKNKNIKKLYFESHYLYKERLNELRMFFGQNIEIIYKCGIETFDESFRNNILKKGVFFESPKEVAKYFDSICLMVGIEGQTKQMIDRDIEILVKNFKYGCVNLYVENTTEIKRSKELQTWFKEKYFYLEDNPNIDVLWNNLEFGVGEGI